MHEKERQSQGEKNERKYLQELGELEVAEALLAVVSKVQADELAVPVEGNVVVHSGLAEDVPHILCSANTHLNEGWLSWTSSTKLCACDVRKEVEEGRREQETVHVRDHASLSVCND